MAVVLLLGLSVGGRVGLLSSADAAVPTTTTTVTLATTNDSFVDTGVYLPAGAAATITATGSGTCNDTGTSDCPPGDADGTATCESIDFAPGPAGPGFDYGAIVGRVGTGAPFPVGNAGTAKGPGELYLVYNDCYYGDNAGSYQVKIVAPTPPSSVSVTLNPNTVNVCGVVCSTANAVNAKVLVTAADGSALPGQSIAMSANQPGVSFSPVTDNGNGTYTTTITPSSYLGKVTVTATDSSGNPAVVGTATLTQECNPDSAGASPSASLRSDFTGAPVGEFSAVRATAATASSCPTVTINNAATLSMGGPLSISGTGWSTAPGAGAVKVYLRDSAGRMTLVGTEQAVSGAFTSAGAGPLGAVPGALTVQKWSTRPTYPRFNERCQLNLVAVQGTTTAQTSASAPAIGGVVYYEGTSMHGYKNGDVYCTGEDPLSESDGSLMVLAPNDGSSSGPVRLLVDDPDASITVHNGQKGGVYLEPKHSLCIGVVGFSHHTPRAVVISASGGVATASTGPSSSCGSSPPPSPAVAPPPAGPGVASDCSGLVAQYIGAEAAASTPGGPVSIGGNAAWRARGNLRCTDHYFDASFSFIDDFYVASATIDGNFRLDTKLSSAGPVAVSGSLLLGGGVSASSIATGGDVSLLLGPTPHLSSADKADLLKLSAFLTSRAVGTPLTYAGVPLGILGIRLSSASWVGAVLAVVGAKLTWDSNSMADLAVDPPDLNFRTKTTANFPNFAGFVPPGGFAGSARKRLDLLLATCARTVGLERALQTAVDRAGGATDAGDTSAERSQLKAAGAFASRLAPLELEFISNLRAARRVLSRAHLAAIKISARAVARLAGATKHAGLPAATAQLLKRAGISSGQIANLRSQIETLPHRSVTIKFPAATPRLVTSIRKEVTILNAFAARMRTNPLAPFPSSRQTRAAANLR